MPDPILPSTPTDRLPDDERRALVRTLIGQMGRERERQALVRFHVGGESGDALAAALGLSTGRLHRALHRARLRYQTLRRGRAAAGDTGERQEGARDVPPGGAAQRGDGERDPEHAEIDGAALVERYHPGDLSADERVRFEAHFAACPHCRAALETARELHRTLRRVAAEDVTEVALARAGVATWMARRGRYLGTVLVVLALIVVGVGAVWYGSRLRHQEGQIAATRADAAALQELVERERRRAARLSAELEERRQLWHEEREALLDRLAAPRPVLEPARMGETFALAVDLSAGPAFPSYTITVTAADGAVELRRSDLRTGELDLLVVRFPTDLLPAGDHRLLVQGVSGEGRVSAVATVPFRIVAGTAGE